MPVVSLLSFYLKKCPFRDRITKLDPRFKKILNIGFEYTDQGLIKTPRFMNYKTNPTLRPGVAKSEVKIFCDFSLCVRIFKLNFNIYA